MQFQLKANGKVLCEANTPAEIDYSTLHKIALWEIVAVYPDGVRLLAKVDWQSASFYSVYINHFSAPVGRIQCHSQIIPTIQGALKTWGWENRLGPDNDTQIIIRSEI